MAHDNCDHCGEDYEFDKERDFLVIFIRHPQCNHVLATCPHCNEVTRIYLVPEGVMQVAELKLPMRLGTDAPQEVLEAAQALWRSVAEDSGLAMFGDEPEEDEDDQPEVHYSNSKADPYAPPKDWLRQLYDELRHFDKPCDGSCDSSH